MVFRAEVLYLGEREGSIEFFVWHGPRFNVPTLYCFPLRWTLLPSEQYLHRECTQFTVENETLKHCNALETEH